jgi:cytoskeletal protein CcmA (bactofilin family)
MADKEKTTVIGQRTRVAGNIEGDEDLVVKGRVEGTIRLTETLRVEEGGIVQADVHVKSCIVSGVVVGDVTATESVHLTETCRMVGDIQSPRIVIVAGAAFRGKVDMGDMETERMSTRSSSKIPVVDRSGAKAPATPMPAKEDAPAKTVMVARPQTPTRPTTQGAVAPRIATARQPPPAPPALSGKRNIRKK